jgi:glycerate kinase
MKILIAPNAFKGTLTAARAASAIAAGARGAFPGARLDLLPVADGGDGLLEALAPALGGRFMRTRVEGPLGDMVPARWLLAGRTAVIEMAEASGLRRLGGRRLKPLDASTRGVGQLMLAAIASGAKEIVVGLGGSASNDGGAGCAQAFGFSLVDGAGREIPPGAKGLARIAAVFPGEARRRLRGVKVTGLADVKNRLCGRLGSARVFGPQKGASPLEVAFMERALERYAAVLRRCLGVPVAGLRGGAAAGGLGAGLAAFFGAELDDGSSYVLSRLGFEARLAKADLVITGEGRFDSQTFYGKAPGAVIAAARRQGKPAAVVCGRSLVERARGVAIIAEAGMKPSPFAALRRAAAGLTGLPAARRG